MCISRRLEVSHDYVLRLIAITTLVALAPPVAAAQQPHRRPPVAVPVHVAPAVQGPRQPALVKRASTPTKPFPRPGRSVANPGAINQLKTEIDRTPITDAELPDLLLRLAGLYAQSYEYWSYRASEAKDKGKPNAGHERQATAEMQHALMTYQRLVDEAAFAQYARMDEALYAYAFTLQQSGSMKDARKLFQRLIVEYPASNYIPDAYLAFADYYFDHGSMANAERFYDKVLQYPQSKVYGYALYKKGWVNLNLGQDQDALEAFFKAHAHAKAKQPDLARAARGDFVRAYAAVGKPQVAYAAFSRLDKTEAVAMLEHLARLYADQGMAQKETVVNRKLIQLQPRDARVCEWQLAIARAALASGGRPQTLIEVENATRVSQSLGTPECLDDVRVMTGELARRWHSESYQAYHAADVMRDADRLYSAYEAAFPKAPDISDTRYYHAELLWQRANAVSNGNAAHALWTRAAAAFDAVAKDPGASRSHRSEARDAAGKARDNAAAVAPRGSP